MPVKKCIGIAAGLALLVGLVANQSLQAGQARSATSGSGAVEKGSVSSGFATDLKPVPGYPPRCSTNVNVQPDVFPIRVGTVTSDDGKKWTAPAPVVSDGAMAVDVYNNCVGPGDNPDYVSQLKTVVVDNDGVEITGFIHADNYFELYVNGKFIARDSIAMTPFNTSVVRFKAKYPMTYAIMGVDWETHQGIGMEYNVFNVGDAGMIAYFSDGNGTHTDWRADTFYIAPLDDPACVRVTEAGRDSSFCSQSVRPACGMKPETCKALHFPIPADWNSPRFNDSRWPLAIFWRPVEVTNQQSYTSYAQLFGDAEFIWTRNLHLDNLVLARYTAKGPKRK